jgi:DNA-binding MarR family transcriptional regulator
MPARLAQAVTAEATAASAAELDLSVIENNVGFRLRLAFLAFFRSLEGVLAPFELRPGLAAALFVIEANPGQKQQEIGKAVGIKRPNLVLVIDELERRGLVRRHPAPGDGRSYALRLTPLGTAMMKDIHAVHDAHEQAVLESLGQDREAFRRGLRKIAELDG